MAGRRLSGLGVGEFWHWGPGFAEVLGSEFRGLRDSNSGFNGFKVYKVHEVFGVESLKLKGFRFQDVLASGSIQKTGHGLVS